MLPGYTPYFAPDPWSFKNDGSEEEPANKFSRGLRD